jgi:hypothetical protein
LVEVMAVQTQLMQRMAEAMEHHGNGGNRVAPQDEDLMRKIERFMSEGPHLQLLGRPARGR